MLIKKLRIEVTRVYLLDAPGDLEGAVNWANNLTAEHIAKNGRNVHTTINHGRLVDVLPDPPAMLVPPIGTHLVIPYVTRLLADGYLIIPYHGHKWLDAHVVDPTHQWCVGDLTMGSHCCASGSPSLRPYAPGPVDKPWSLDMVSHGYRLTQEDWTALTTEFKNHCGEQRLGGRAFTNTYCPWYDGKE
jgi:hypothetical protein